MDTGGVQKAAGASRPARGSIPAPSPVHLPAFTASTASPMKIRDLNAIPDSSVSHNPAITKRVMLQNGELSNLVYFSQARFQPGHIASAHSHADMSEVFFVESGSGIIRINGETHPLTPGICIAIEPGDLHEIENDSDDDLVLTYFAILV